MDNKDLEFRPSPSVLRTVAEGDAPRTPVVSMSWTEVIHSEIEFMRQCERLIVKGFHQTIAFCISNPIDQTLRAVIAAWGTGEVPRTQCIICWGFEVETEKVAQNAPLPVGMTMEGPGYLSHCL